MTPRAAHGASFEAVASAIVRDRTGVDELVAVDEMTWFATHPQGARR
jgi:hypothetical protein